MASAQTNPWEKYAPIPKADTQSRRIYEGKPRTFQVVDMTNMTKETLEVGGDPVAPAKKKRVAKKKEVAPIVSQETPREDDDVIGEEYFKTLPALEKQLEEIETVAHEEPTLPVKFFTDMMETSIMAYHVFSSEGSFVIFTPSDDRVKIKPKRGVRLSADHGGKVFNLYSSGIHFPMPNGWDCSIFFIVVEGEE